MVDLELEKGIKLFEKGEYQRARYFFSMALGKNENNLMARQYLGRSYYRDEKSGSYDLALEHFQVLYNSDDEEKKYYGASMIAIIKGLRGEHDYSIKLLRKLPETINNTINLAIVHIMKFKATNENWLLEESKRILDTLQIIDIPTKFHWRIFISYGMVFQYSKNLEQSEKYYNKALRSTKNNLNRGKILNEYGLLKIETGQLKQADDLLNEALSLIENKSIREVAFNSKYRGILEIRRNKHARAKDFLQEASKIYKEKGLLTELADVYRILVELENPSKDFYSLANNYSESVFTRD